MEFAQRKCEIDKSYSHGGEAIQVYFMNQLRNKHVYCGLQFRHHYTPLISSCLRCKQRFLSCLLVCQTTKTSNNGYIKNTAQPFWVRRSCSGLGISAAGAGPRGGAYLTTGMRKSTHHPTPLILPSKLQQPAKKPQPALVFCKLWPCPSGWHQLYGWQGSSTVGRLIAVR